MKQAVREKLGKAPAARKQKPAASTSGAAGHEGGPPPNGYVGQPGIDNAAALARAAVEAWRLERRVAGSGDDRLVDSIRRLRGELENAGCRLEDLAGAPYVDGAVLEVIGEVPSSGRLRIGETIRPAVYVHGTLQLPAQVIIVAEE